MLNLFLKQAVTNFDVGIYVNRETQCLPETSIKIEEDNDPLPTIDKSSTSKRNHVGGEYVPINESIIKRTRTKISSTMANEQLRPRNSCLTMAPPVNIDDVVFQPFESSSFNDSSFLPSWNFTSAAPNGMGTTSNNISPLEIWPGSSIDGMTSIPYFSNSLKSDSTQTNDLIGDAWMNNNDQFSLIGKI